MTNYAIRVEDLSKQYTIGARNGPYRTLRESLMTAIRAPFQRILHPAGGLVAENTLWALKDVSFQIDQGEIVGIIGRNGAGKSTLLKILSRITVPTTGKVSVRGRIASLLEVGTGFHPELTGRENVFLNGAILGMTRSEVRQRFDEIVNFADVERFIDTPVKHYSSGMYMRLAFAIAAHLETDILLVDEVLAVGDVSFQQKCLAKMEDVAGHGRTVLFVSHNMTAVQSLCGRAIHLEDGKIKGDGETKQEIVKYLVSAIPRQTQRELVRVGDALTIASIEMRPNPVESGGDLHFEISLTANSPLRLSEAALLLHAAEGPRVGIIDLREAGFPFAMRTGESLTISGLLNSIPLVENQYRVGLYIDSGPFAGDVRDVADLVVSFPAQNLSYSRYRPDARGWVEFKTQNISSIKKNELLAVT